MLRLGRRELSELWLVVSWEFSRVDCLSPREDVREGSGINGGCFLDGSAEADVEMSGGSGAGWEDSMGVGCWAGAYVPLGCSCDDDSGSSRRA